MRRLAGNDPEVNEEWITDKDRFAFHYAHLDDRLTYPRVREDGELRPASWSEAFAVAARGLAAAGPTGVLTGGRLTAEDAFAYSTFARVASCTFVLPPNTREAVAGDTPACAATSRRLTAPTLAGPRDPPGRLRLAPSLLSMLGWYSVA